MAQCSTSGNANEWKASKANKKHKIHFKINFTDY